MADSESSVSMKSLGASSSAVTMVTSLKAPPSDVMEAVNQSNEIIPALFALPSESGDTKKLKLCKRVGWLRNGVFTTGFMEINIKEAKQKGIFSQPRHVTLVQEEDSTFQSQVIQGQKVPSCKQLSSLVLSPGTSTMGLISTRGKVIPKRITVVKNVPFANKSAGKLVALCKAPSVGTPPNKAGTSADTATGHQNRTAGNEVAMDLSMSSRGISPKKVDERKLQDSAPGWLRCPQLSSHSKESLHVEDQKVCVKQVHAAPTGEPQSCPAKKIRQKQKHSPRITRKKMKDGIASKVSKLGSQRTDTCHLQSLSNPKLDLLKLDIDFSRYNVLQMEGLMQSPCDPTPNEFNCLEQKKIPETRRKVCRKVQEVPELYSLLSKGTTNKHLKNQTIAQSKKMTVKNVQCIPECSNQAADHHKEPKQVRQSGRMGIEEVVQSTEKRKRFQKRNFDELCSPSNYRAAPKFKYNMSRELLTQELSCGEPSVKYIKVEDTETSGTPTTNLGSSTGHSQQVETDPFAQNEREGCSKVALSGDQDVIIQNKRPKCDTSDNLMTNANTCSLHDVEAEASSQNNKGISTNLPTSSMQTSGQQTSLASHDPPVNFSTSVSPGFVLREDNRFGNDSRNTLSTTTISETNDERPSLPSDSSVDKASMDQASDGFPLLQIGSVYSLSAEEAKRLFPKASVETHSELVDTNQSPVYADSSVPISSSTCDPVVEPSATKVNLEPLHLIIDSQPSQSRAADVSVCPIQTHTIETAPATPSTLQITRPSSSAMSNPTVTSTIVQHTIQMSPVVCVNGQVLTLVPGKLPGKVNKAPENPTEFVISPPGAAHSAGQNLTPKTLRVSHSQVQNMQTGKVPSQQHSKAHTASSFIVPLSTSPTVTVLDPSAPRNPDNKSSTVANSSNVPVQSTLSKTPMFHYGSFEECNTTPIPTSVMSTAASAISCSTSAGSVCTSVSSSSSVGSICSTDTDSTQKPTPQEMSTASNRDTLESEGQRTLLITTTLGKSKLTSFPSTANILSQMAQTRDYRKHRKAKKHRRSSRDDANVKKTRKVSEQTQMLTRGSGDKNTKKGKSLKIETDKNPQSDLREKPRRKRRGHNKPSPAKAITKGPRATALKVTTHSLSESFQVTLNGGFGDKCNTSKVTKPSSQSDGTTKSRLTLPQRNDNRKKRKTYISSNVNEKETGLSMDVRNKGITPETQSNVSKKVRTPATPLNTSRKGTTPSSQPNVSKKGSPPSATSLKSNRRSTTPSSQPNVRKRGRLPSTAPLNTDPKDTTPSSQSNTRRKGRPPSSHSNVSKKRRAPAALSNVSQKGASPQSALSRERSTPASSSNIVTNSCSTSSLADVNRKCDAQATRSSSNKKRNSTSPATRSGAKKKYNSTLSAPGVNQKSSRSAIRWSVNKNDATVSSRSGVYRVSSLTPYLFREDRLMQLKELMKQKEQDIEDMKKLRQLEVREKLSDPELCDL